MAEREVVFEHVMEPGTGKAVPVLRGQILRIEQLGKGQCADFNAFNAEQRPNGYLIPGWQRRYRAGATRWSTRNRQIFPDARGSSECRP